MTDQCDVSLQNVHQLSNTCDTFSPNLMEEKGSTRLSFGVSFLVIDHKISFKQKKQKLFCDNFETELRNSMEQIDGWTKLLLELIRFFVPLRQFCLNLILY